MKPLEVLMLCGVSRITSYRLRLAVGVAMRTELVIFVEAPEFCTFILECVAWSTTTISSNEVLVIFSSKSNTTRSPSGAVTSLITTVR